jgi:hypothetical protein
MVFYIIAVGYGGVIEKFLQKVTLFLSPKNINKTYWNLPDLFWVISVETNIYN